MQRNWGTHGPTISLTAVRDDDHPSRTPGQRHDPCHLHRPWLDFQGRSEQEIMFRRKDSWAHGM